ncbi:facilitated trehalose transporter Tret1-like [Diorhabda carinulata]|uniref:facilitated trehalose transporter Tret1-like n=1 Tax=Diorhabda carinulata TaxID=1163345 RepID=UPI0025A1147E|nr:facilitated trehalose transporter Tret1-like [Diorhabda carinulata]
MRKSTTNIYLKLNLNISRTGEITTFKMPFNVALYQAAFAVNLLSINTASVFSWASPSIPLLSSNDKNINPLGRPVTTFEESCIASLGSAGSVIGTLLSGYVAEKLGRKKTLFVFSIPTVILLILTANATNIYLLYLARLILGSSAGCVLNVLPSFIGEISEDSNRGTLGGIFGIMSGIGHLLCFGIGPLVSIRTFAYILLAPVSIFICSYFFLIPESPRYLVSKDDHEEARKNLKRIRKSSNIEKELQYLILVEQNTKNGDKVSLKELFNSPVVIRGLFISCSMFLIQQITGVGFILAFLQQILEASGGVIPPAVACVIIGFVQIIFSLFSTVLVDRVGRKILLHISSTGLSLSMLSIGIFFVLKDYNCNVDSIFWLPLAGLIGFYIFLNVGYGFIPWTLCGELFTTNTKSLCVTISTSFCLLLNSFVNASFPLLRDTLGMGGVFIMFGTLTGLSCIFVALVVPETKGKSFEEIQNALRPKPKSIVLVDYIFDEKIPR